MHMYYVGVCVFVVYDMCVCGVWYVYLDLICTRRSYLYPQILYDMCVCGVWYVRACDVYGQILLHFAAHTSRYK